MGELDIDWNEIYKNTLYIPEKIPEWLEGTWVNYEEVEEEMSREKIIDKSKLKVGKWYKCMQSISGLTVGKFYKIKSISHSFADEWFRVETDDGEEDGFNIKTFDISSESDYDVVDVTLQYTATAVVKFDGSDKEYHYKLTTQQYEKLKNAIKVKLSVEVSGKIKLVKLIYCLSYLSSKATKGINAIEELDIVPETNFSNVWERKLRSGETSFNFSIHGKPFSDWSEAMAQINVEGWDNPDFIHPTAEGHLWIADYCKNLDLLYKRNINVNQQEESNMSNQVNRRVVTVNLLDNDAGLPVEHSFVGSWSEVVTEDSNEVTIQEIISTGQVKTLLEQHNEVRAAQVDLEILKRTGNSVNLRPVKLKDLTWKVVG